MTVPLQFRLLKVGHCRHPECIAQRGGQWKSISFPALVGLLIHPTRGPMLFDTGYAPKFFTATEPFPERLYRWVTPVSYREDDALIVQLARYGFTAKDIQHIFISHLHADHIAGLCDYPTAGLTVMREETDAALRLTRIAGLRQGFLRKLLPSDFHDRVSYANDCAILSLGTCMSSFGTGFDLLGARSVIGVPLPGHTAGQMGILFQEQSGRDVFLVADACWSIGALTQGQLPSRIAASLFSDRKMYRQTFSALQRLRINLPDLWIVPSHCDTTWRQYAEKSHSATR